MELGMIGNFSYSLDEKGRLVIPSKFRHHISGELFLSLGFENTLELRTASQYNQWISFLDNMPTLDVNTRNLKRAMLGNTYKIELDKAGRINIPIQLQKISLIKKDVVVVGTNSKIEIWDEPKWNEFINKVGKGLLEDSANNLNKKINGDS